MERKSDACPVCAERIAFDEQKMTVFGEAALYWHERDEQDRHIFCVELADGSQMSVVDEQPQENSPVDPIRSTASLSSVLE